MFIDEFYDPFYQQLPVGCSNEANFKFGQFFKVHAYYPHENLELWRPVPDPNEQTKTIATSFRIVPAGQDAFRRSLPLHTPKLETNEEFLVIRAKTRPVILIQTERPLAGVFNHGFRGKIQRRRVLVAQVYGLHDVKTGRQEFNPSFIERVRKLEFPQLVFLPQQAGLFRVDSLLRLDEAQSVFVPQMEPTQFAFCQDVEALLRAQLLFLATGESTAYTELREMFLES